MTSAAPPVPKTVLNIALNVEDDWPPVSVEGLPCTPIGDAYRIDSPPLFVADVSVGDVLSVSRDNNGVVTSWITQKKSKRSTIWLLRKSTTETLEVALSELRRLKCNTVALTAYGCYAIDVPENCDIKQVDACLDSLDASRIAIAYPSFRHDE